MKKVLSIGIVLVLCLVMSSTGLTADETPVSKVKKCASLPGVVGGIEIPGEGFLMWVTGTPTVITVTGEKMLPVIREDGTTGDALYYRFSGAYDKPNFACKVHGFHGWDEYSSTIPEAGHDKFYLPAEEGVCK